MANVKQTADVIARGLAVSPKVKRDWAASAGIGFRDNWLAVVKRKLEAGQSASILFWGDSTTRNSVPADGTPRRYPPQWADSLIASGRLPATPRTIKSGPSADTCLGKEVAKNNPAGIALVTTISAAGEYQIDGPVFVCLGTESSDGTFWIAGK